MMIPQMSPMNWLFLMFFNLMNYLLLMLYMYYYYLNMNFCISIIKIEYKNYFNFKIIW